MNSRAAPLLSSVCHTAKNQVSRHPRISLTAGMSEGALLTQTDLPLSVCVRETVCYMCVCVWYRGVWQAFPPRLLFPWWRRDASREGTDAGVWLLVSTLSSSFSPSPFRDIPPILPRLIYTNSSSRSDRFPPLLVLQGFSWERKKK